MDAVKFLIEKERMCRDETCNLCPVSATNNSKRKSCDKFIVSHPEEYVQAVEKWAEEHPREIDWLKVPPGTAVKVRGSSSNISQRADFCCYVPNALNKYGVYINTHDYRRVAPEEANAVEFWTYCELDSSVDPTPYYL